jgi:ribosomal protein S18 acetylase RimI-like enzyme
MITQLELDVRDLGPADRQKVANLLHFEAYVHRHLDWRTPLDWLGETPYLAAEQHQTLVAALACPPEQTEVAWLRVFAVAGHIARERAWKSLWAAAQAQLRADPQVRLVAAIPLQDWFEVLLVGAGFTATTRVVMLHWERQALSESAPPSDFTLRPMSLDDIAGVACIDADAFGPLWRNSPLSLELAYRQAAVATVAERDGSLIGYQISTGSPVGGHLARLAVGAGLQGRGVGQALVKDVLSQFARRGAQVVTVNTQENNRASLALYQKAGFQLTGEGYPVYEYPLERGGA